ncbi:MAG: glutaredoxin [Candidatus Helarchaeota archaeon]|nr:glutaredoxin [Candidatus Helarchaeota archaeon]
MEPKTVSGNIQKHDVMLYTISTCIWCVRLKNKLKNRDIQYKYIDIDLIPHKEKERIKRQLREVKSRLAFPMMFVDDSFIPNMETDQKIEELVRDGNDV